MIDARRAAHVADGGAAVDHSKPLGTPRWTEAVKAVLKRQAGVPPRAQGPAQLLHHLPAERRQPGRGPDQSERQIFCMVNSLLRPRERCEQVALLRPLPDGATSAQQSSHRSTSLLCAVAVTPRKPCKKSDAMTGPCVGLPNP